MKNTTVVGDALNIHGNITDLMPYTTYWVAVSVMSRGGEGLQSDPKFATTLEAAPEPPLNLIISEVTNTSMVVSWVPPRLMNGVLQYYNIHYNSNYTNPGMVNNVKVERSNVSQILVQWQLPLERGGLVDRYELKVEEAGNGQNITGSHNTTGTNFTIPVRECDDQPRAYKIWVRAVNIDNTSKPSEILYHGQWSGPAGIDSCYDTGFTQINVIIWTLCVVLCALVVLAIWFYGK
ncbi:hypothetical protein B566_EDAN009716, partial [Ephemera danica]